MIGGTIFLQTFSYYGGGFGTLLNELSQTGFFSFVLPFLLIFSLIYGLLLKLNLFKDNNSINGVIAFSISLMAIQFEFVPLFFSQIFPRLGVGLAVILTVLITVGLFLPKQNWVVYALFGVSLLTVIIILSSSAEALGWMGSYGIGYWLMENWPTIFALAFVAISISLTLGKKKDPSKFDEIQSPILKDLHKVLSG